MIKHIKLLNDTKRRETLKYLILIAEEKELSHPKYIAVKNGIVNLETAELIPYSTKFILKNKIDIDYHKCEFPLIDETFDKIAVSNKGLVEIFFEMFGYCLYRATHYQKCFVFVGEGSNGKSTLLELLEDFLTEKNASSVEIKDLTENRFKLAELYGKLANIADDTSAKYIEDSSVFKKLVTGQKISAEKKGQDPFEFRNYAKLIMSCNDIARINDNSFGLIRRLIIIPLNACFKKTDKDFIPEIRRKLNAKEGLEYLLYRAVQAMSNIIKRKGFTESELVDEAIEEYKYMNNPVLQFLDDISIKNIPTTEVYKSYDVWCTENGHKKNSNSNFRQRNETSWI